MKTTARYLLLSGLVMFPTGNAFAERVVGSPDAKSAFFVAVRGLVPQGAVISGIRFYSNDTTSFPEVLLTGDLGTRGLPTPGPAIRSIESVRAPSGQVLVEFEPYTVPDNEYLWAIVRFPDAGTLRAEGPGGGPGIGWRELKLLENERSLFSVDGAMNEFAPAFDIALHLSGDATSNLQKASSRANTEQASDLVASRLSVQALQHGVGSVLFRLAVPKPGDVVIDLYTVAGRHVIRLEEQLPSPGNHVITWPAIDKSRRRIAAGIYVYRVRFQGEEQAGKIVVLQ